MLILKKRVKDGLKVFGMNNEKDRITITWYVEDCNGYKVKKNRCVVLE
jgi:hypothetical protein